MNSCHLITGGAGFIGSCHVLQTRASGTPVVTLDKLTYSGNLANLASLAGDADHVFVQGDIGNSELVAHLLRTHRPSAVINFAAESHVDRSILDPEAFVRTNVLGTQTLLEAARQAWEREDDSFRPGKRFLYVSTDEVYGSLGEEGFFTEKTPYAPNGPYSASKAASDLLVRAYCHTYGLNATISNCSNNYGPWQHSEKLIPTIIRKALAHEAIPLYGNGSNVRDWIWVMDHCRAVDKIFHDGQAGESYNVGSHEEHSNLDMMRIVCHLLDRLEPWNGHHYEELIKNVTDRPGHDFRYAIDASKIRRELGWNPEMSFETGIKQTVQWYLNLHRQLANQ